MRIPVAKKTRYLDEKSVSKRSLPYARKSLGSRAVHLEKIELLFKQFYFQKILALASRFPFKPKHDGYVVFFDSASGLAGLTVMVPKWEEAEILDEQLWEPAFSVEQFKETQSALVEKYLLRRYLLKRPELRDIGLDTIWLPYYRCTYTAGTNAVHVVLNAETGGLNI